MASEPQSQLPLFYKDLMPLNSRDHANWRARTVEKASWLAGQHAIPLTVEEFPLAQRHFPIVFSTGDNPVPLALMGLNEGQPSDHTQGVLDFGEKFEEAGARTQAFMKELEDAGLLMEGEVAIQQNDKPDQPYLYRGFKMVNQEKLKELDTEKLKAWHDNGLLPLIYAHLLSLDLMRFVFAKQTEQGKGPAAANGAAVN